MDTELGGARRDFPATSARFQAALRDPAARGAVMDMLAERYWKPVYSFIRRAYSKSNEDAKDLTQAFFAWLLERDLFAKYDPRSSSFRTYLKGLLRNFSGNEHQAALRLKRGGGIRFLPLEEVTTADPDEAFDGSWKSEVVARAMSRVKERYKRRIVAWLVFEGSLTGLKYSELAAKFGVKEDDVRNYLREIRNRIRAEVQAELEATGETGDFADGIMEKWA